MPSNATVEALASIRSKWVQEVYRVLSDDEYKFKDLDTRLISAFSAYARRCKERPVQRPMDVAIYDQFVVRMNELMSDKSFDIADCKPALIPIISNFISMVETDDESELAKSGDLEREAAERYKRAG